MRQQRHQIDRFAVDFNAQTQQPRSFVGRQSHAPHGSRAALKRRGGRLADNFAAGRIQNQMPGVDGNAFVREAGADDHIPALRLQQRQTVGPEIAEKIFLHQRP